MTFFAELQRQQWRIIRIERGTEINICGAINEEVARETCAILNRREAAK